MAKQAGSVLESFAYAHPFLEGNGRTIMVVHTVLAERAGFSIDWSQSLKADYLDALTLDLKAAKKEHLDRYLQPLIGTPLGYETLAAHVAGIEGLKA